MDFMELYKVCKPYCDYVEANMMSVQTLSDANQADSYDDFVSLLNGREISLEKDLVVFDNLYKLQLDIELPIKEEVANTILRNNDTERENAELTFKEIIEETIGETLNVGKISYEEIDALLNDWLKR